MNCRIKLPKDLVDIIDIYVVNWDEYKIRGNKIIGLTELNSLQEIYLKESLKEIIKDSNPKKISLIDVITYVLINNGNLNKDSAFIKSSELGSINLVKYFYYNNIINLTRSTENACVRGYLHIVKYLMGKKYTFDYNYFMTLASKNGRLDIVKYLITNNANNYGECMQYASKHGHIHVVKHLSKYDVSDRDYHYSINDARRNKHYYIVRYLEK